MSHFVAIRPLGARAPAIIQPAAAVSMDEVLSGPIRGLYQSGQLRGPVEVAIVDLTSPDGRLADKQLSHAANDAGTAESDRLAHQLVGALSDAIAPNRDLVVVEPEQRPTAVIRKLALVR